MRKLLLLALLLYDIVAFATRGGNYDYDEQDAMKRHPYDDRRSWRKKALLKSMDMDHKDWEMERRRHDYDMRYFDELEAKSLAREADYRRRLEEKASSSEKGPPPAHPDGVTKSMEHLLQNIDKEKDAKNLAGSCDRQHERFEPCFAGCAAVSCDNPRDRLRPCYPFCEPGCVCVAPFVRDDRTHKCIMPDECTKGLKGIPDIGEEM